MLSLVEIVGSFGLVDSVTSENLRDCFDGAFGLPVGVLVKGGGSVKFDSEGVHEFFPEMACESRVSIRYDRLRQSISRYVMLKKGVCYVGRGVSIFEGRKENKTRKTVYDDHEMLIVLRFGERPHEVDCD